MYRRFNNIEKNTTISLKKKNIISKDKLPAIVSCTNCLSSELVSQIVISIIIYV